MKDEQEPKTLAEVEKLIQRGSEALTEEDLERYLQFAAYQEKLDEENCMAVLRWG